MEIIKYIIIGLLQGVTEPLPISSSGHVRILGHLLESDFLNDLTLEIIVNFGSLIAILYIYREDLFRIIEGTFAFLFKKTEDASEFKYAMLLVLGTIPAGLLGFLLKDVIEEALQSIKIVGAALLVTALALFFIRKLVGKKDDHEITWVDALTIGLFQAVALLPGISRSGATLVGAMTRQLKRESALRFSFLLYIPISLATMLLGILDYNNGMDMIQFVYYLVAFTFALFGTLYATRWFINLVSKSRLIYFTVYCLIVGSLVLIFL